MRAYVKIDGVEKLVRGLRGLGEAAQNRIIRNAARAGAAKAASALRQAAPRGDMPSKASATYGSLRKNIKHSQYKARLPYYVVTTRDAFWGAFLDTGTGVYNIDPGPRAKGAAARTHIAPRRWWRNTVERERPQITRAMIDNIAQSIQREVDKLG